MDLERSVVADTLKKHDGNVSRAAEELGSSRRTVQLRMKTYGIPPGHAGRPRVPLPYKDRWIESDSGLTTIVILGAAGLALYWWMNRKDVQILGADEATGLRGLDVICRR